MGSVASLAALSTCCCASISPGSTRRPPRSIVSASPASGGAPVPTLAMRPCSSNIHSAMVWAVPSSAAASMALGPASAAWDHCQIRPFISRVGLMRLGALARQEGALDFAWREREARV